MDGLNHSPRKHIARLAPDRALRLKKFGESLGKRVRDMDLNQSQFAERAAVHMKNGRFGRDLVSNYINGRSQPEPLHQVAMAKALGISVEELMAPLYSGMMCTDDTSSPIDLQSVGGDRARLRINVELPMAVAVQILTLLPQGAGK
jgi:transcriptional regulator with XRE-family HTH domain